MTVKRVRRALSLFIVGAFLTALTGDSIDLSNPFNRLAGRTSAIQFSYIGWMNDAILHKIGQEIGGNQDYLTEAQRSAYVRDYLQSVARLQTLDGEIARAYASTPAAENPEARTADLRKRRDDARAEVARREPLAESIIEGQIASVLRDEGFATLGQIVPPVAAHITQLPALLVISPRDAIKVENSLNIVTLSADRASELEDSIDRDLKVSSLIVPLGGLSLFPSMVIQTWYAPNLFEVVAHEWCHHYLYFFPLGLTYDVPEARIINESTAVLFGREIARITILRFYSQYPDIIQQLPLPVSPEPKATSTPAGTATPIPATPPPFDYGREMNATRIEVDRLLAAGQPVQAERYMAERKLLFSQNGYAIRKLNQAFFAFYGGYQGTGGSSAGGTDPIGPAIARIRSASPSVRGWLEVMRGITSRAALLDRASADDQPR